MKKVLALALIVAGTTFAASVTGVITDSSCAKGDHKAMNMGNDAECTKACVNVHGAEYVLWDGKTTYTLNDQKTPEQFAAKRVTVSGTIDQKTNAIKVDSIVAAK